MLLPYSTDAPLYHWPIATVGLIVANVLVFCATVLQVFLGSFEPEQVEWLMILFNQINPVQWITGSFIHADPVHLAGNMMFLWAFGLVVEGKCGWWKFLLIYFAILIACAATIQSAMFLLIDRDGGTMGASGAIFGIMMIAMIWAPENEMDCIVVFFRFARTIEIRLAALAGFFIAMQVFLFVYSGMSLSAEVMQLFGVVYAMPIGFWMLRQDIVDCEGWDLVARTDFLLASPVFCTDKQRARQVHREEVKEDAVAVALGSKTTSHHGMVVSSYHQKQADKAAAAKVKESQVDQGSAQSDDRHDHGPAATALGTPRVQSTDVPAASSDHAGIGGCRGRPLVAAVSISIDRWRGPANPLELCPVATVAAELRRDALAAAGVGQGLEHEQQPGEA